MFCGVIYFATSKAFSRKILRPVVQCVWSHFWTRIVSERVATYCKVLLELLNPFTFLNISVHVSLFFYPSLQAPCSTVWVDSQANLYGSLLTRIYYYKFGGKKLSLNYYVSSGIAYWERESGFHLAKTHNRAIWLLSGERGWMALPIRTKWSQLILAISIIS